MTGLVNHVWQSLWFAGGAWAFASLLRPNRAAVRHAIWVAASLKFCVPLALLVALGARIPVHLPLPAVAPAAATVLAPLPNPPHGINFNVALHPSASVQVTLDSGWLLGVLAALWIAGSLSIAVRWLIAWRKIARIVSTGAVLQTGREVTLLRRLLESGSKHRPLTVVRTDDAIEPGVFGVIRPVLLWPSQMSSSLSDAHLTAILEHELAHVRRRDNLWANLHQVVQCAFWFCPAVWWIGSRLVTERERACDEDVLNGGSGPATYAESILLACQHRVRMQAWCLAGVNGSDLQERIRSIMTRPVGRRLSGWKIGLLSVAAIVTFTGPFVIGLTRVQAAAPFPARERAATWDVVTADGRAVMQGFTGDDLLRYAYSLPGRHIVDSPGWVGDESFALSADVDNANDQVLRQSVRRALEDRFGLRAHIETRDLPVYGMVIADSTLAAGGIHTAAPCFDGDLWRASGSPASWLQTERQPFCGGWRTVPSGATYTGVTMTQLAASLTSAADREVVDRTGIDGRFDAALRFFPPTAALMRDSPYAAALLEPFGFHSLLTAARDQLGLALVDSTAAADVLVVDHMTR